MKFGENVEHGPRKKSWDFDGNPDHVSLWFGIRLRGDQTILCMLIVTIILQCQRPWRRFALSECFCYSLLIFSFVHFIHLLWSNNSDPWKWHVVMWPSIHGRNITEWHHQSVRPSVCRSVHPLRVNSRTESHRDFKFSEGACNRLHFESTPHYFASLFTVWA